MIQDATVIHMLLLTDCNHQDQNRSSSFLADSDNRESKHRFSGTSVQSYTRTLSCKQVKREARKAS